MSVISQRLACDWPECDAEMTMRTPTDVPDYNWERRDDGRQHVCDRHRHHSTRDLLTAQGVIDDIEDDTRLIALVEAARDVCPMCGGRALGHPEVSGPNEAGNYVHGEHLCKATAIHSRIAHERRNYEQADPKNP